MHWELSGFDRADSFSLLWECPSQSNVIGLRDCYRDLLCSKCGRIDEFKALQRGLALDVKAPRRSTDLNFSNDAWLVVSGRARKVLDDISGVDVTYYDMPNDPDYFVLVPNVLLYPPRNAPFSTSPYPVDGMTFRMSRHPCEECGRPQIGWYPDQFDAPSDTIVSGVVLDIEGGRSIAIIVNDNVVKALKKAKLTGWRKQALKS
jgi:hypothetical protein